jgi:hypothetical protein
MAEEQCEAISEIAPDLCPRWVTLNELILRVASSPRDEGETILRWDRTAGRPPHIELLGGVVHLEVSGLGGVVGATSPRDRMRLEQVNFEPRAGAPLPGVV